MRRAQNMKYRFIQAMFDEKIQDLTINFYDFLQQVGTIYDQQADRAVERKLREFRRSFCHIESLVDALTHHDVVKHERNINNRFDEIMEIFKDMIIIQMKVCDIVREYGKRQAEMKQRFAVKIGRNFRFSF